jgi:hypothetical protein
MCLQDRSIDDCFIYIFFNSFLNLHCSDKTILALPLSLYSIFEAQKIRHCGQLNYHFYF